MEIVTTAHQTPALRATTDTKLPSAARTSGSHAVYDEPEDLALIEQDRWWSLSGLVAFFASAATAFTVRIVGEMPAGEFLLMAVAGWAFVCFALNQALPGRLFSSRFFWALLIAQVVAFVAYVASDLYRDSAPRDMARGWGRMAFLAIDVIAVTYLCSCSRKNLLWFVIGHAAGLLGYTAVHGPLFGDLWKFGLAAPVTFAVFLLVPWTGAFLTSLVVMGLGWVHFTLDYRSMGGICMVAGVLTLLQRLSPRMRWWIAPVAVSAAIVSVFLIYEQTHRRGRATRSDIERTAMVTAAQEAFLASPWIGHGSWFSNSKVYDNFVLIRHEMAKRDRVGGFAGANSQPGDEALHSQLLVALAEGGLFGGAFFCVFGMGLLWALCDIVLVQPWHRFAPIYILVLLLALWNLLFSPFSGAHRVYIAVACGLILILATEKQSDTAAAEFDKDDFEPLGVH